MKYLCTWSVVSEVINYVIMVFLIWKVLFALQCVGKLMFDKLLYTTPQPVVVAYIWLVESVNRATIPHSRHTCAARLRTFNSRHTCAARLRTFKAHLCSKTPHIQSTLVQQDSAHSRHTCAARLCTFKAHLCSKTPHIQGTLVQQDSAHPRHTCAARLRPGKRKLCHAIKTGNRWRGNKPDYVVGLLLPTWVQLQHNCKQSRRPKATFPRCTSKHALSNGTMENPYICWWSHPGRHKPAKCQY